MFIDIVDVTFKAGDGGAGKSSFRKNKKGPDGGNGGMGGNVYVVAVADPKLLNQFSQETEFSAENGKAGAENGKTGKSGEDIEIKLPVGTSLIDKKTGATICELNEPNQRVLICKGGKGGLGNQEFKGPQNTTPHYAQPGIKGELKELTLSLRLIADFGLIGLPNSGKSSLLNELTGSKSPAANYPFTTLSPELGVIGTKVIADIPGLIEGASGGKGLGIKFLKHVEKVGILLHCISCESADVLKDYEVVKTELSNFNDTLSSKKEIVIITKADLSTKEELQKILTIFKNMGIETISVSIHDFESLENLKKLLV